MNCIVSFANRRGNYIKGLERLAESLRNNFDGEFMAFTSEASIGAPKHEDNPYAFKVYAIQKAIDAGFTNILYLDSSCYAIKNVQPVFDEIEKNGFFAQDSGHVLCDWCNEPTLKHFGVSEAHAVFIPMYGNAGMLGLNMENKAAKDFFRDWETSMHLGYFKGSWENHRHDMTCGSLIAYQQQLHKLYKKGDEWLQYAGPYDATANDTIIFKAQGL